MSSTVADELITLFTLNNKNYKGAGAEVVEITHKIGESFDRAREKAQEFAKSISEKLKFGDVLAPLAGIAMAAGLVDLDKDAVQTSREFDSLTRRIEALTGSLSFTYDAKMGTYLDSYYKPP